MLVPILLGQTVPLPINHPDSAEVRWHSKPMLEERVLDDMEDATHWKHYGYGEMTSTFDRMVDGQKSLRLVAPTVGTTHSAEKGRPYGEAGVTRAFEREDWTQFNRISVWVYPTLPGFNVISLLIKLHNEGDRRVPDSTGREGLNYVILKSGQWNQVVWEIPHLSRDQVTGISLIYRLQGNEPKATNRVCFDFDRLELQKVKADYYEGWSVAPGRIAFSHTGYTLGGKKTAVASGWQEQSFDILRQDSGDKVLSKYFKHINNDLGRFQLLDFSEIRESGTYVIRIGDFISRPFRVANEVWDGTIEKILNFYFCERCGFAVPGIHDVCHKDWHVKDGTNTILINGGWHDAGDLSQGLVNTAESAYAMLSLATKLQSNLENYKNLKFDKTSVTFINTNKSHSLANQLIQEAAWGLDWILKTRIGPGRRVGWSTMDLWTDGILGNFDDIQGKVSNSVYDNLVAIATEAKAYQVFRHSNRPLAERCLLAAIEDWESIQPNLKSSNLEMASQGVLSALELFAATGKSSYTDFAFQWAETIMQCQQNEFTPWKIPLIGFFYTQTNHQHLLYYSHRGHEQAPIVALTSLCEKFPLHPSWMDWYASVYLHSEYLKTLIQFTEPYGMIPAGIYQWDESQELYYQQQLANGIPLSPNYYLRRFPVWTSFRGNYGVLLSQTKALATSAHLRRDWDGTQSCQQQLQWIVGRNPFAQSTLYGEGYDFAPQYTAMSGDMVGSLPVGIQTRESEDKPYWPAANCYNYKEVWVHPTARWLWLMENLNGPALVTGIAKPGVTLPIQFIEPRTKKRITIKPASKSGDFACYLPEGRYQVVQDDRILNVVLLPNSVSRLDLRQGLQISVDSQTEPSGKTIVRLELEGTGMHWFKIRTHNLKINADSQQVVTLQPGKKKNLEWSGEMLSLNRPWIAIIVPNDDLDQRVEISGKRK